MAQRGTAGRIAVRRGNGEHRTVELRQRIGPVASILASGPVDPGELDFHINATAHSYTLSVAHPGGTLMLGDLSSRYLSSEVAGSFTGVFVGMYASGNGHLASAPSWWTHFAYSPARAR